VHAPALHHNPQTNKKTGVAVKSYWIGTRGHEATLQLREVPVPQPKPGEIVGRVHATAMNRGELIVGGAVHGGPEKLGGTEAAGVIHALGEGVTGWNTGDRVMGRARGTFAAYAPMKAHMESNAMVGKVVVRMPA